jgi:hypothetical protein
MTLIKAMDKFRRATGQSRRIPTREVLSSAQPAPNADNRPAFPLVRAYVEPPAGIEPATPSLPSMRGWFTTPCSTPRTHTTTQVRGAFEGRVVRRREATRSTVSGKFLAQQPSTSRRPLTDLAEPGAHRLWGWLVTSRPRHGSRRRGNHRRRRGLRQPPRTAALPCQTPLWRRAARAARTLRATAALRSRSSLRSSAIMAR